MKKALAVLAAALLLLGGCVFGNISGSGNLQTKQYDITGFTGVEAGWAFQVTITRSDTYSVNVTIDDNLVDDLIVTKSGSTLVIRLKPGYIYASYTARAEITMPEILSLDFSGASTCNIGGFESSEGFDASASGASTIIMDEMVYGKKITLEVSGASRISGNITTGGDARLTASGASIIMVSGSANDLDGDASGASRLSLDDFKVNNARVDLSGASSAGVNISGTLDASVSGASHLQYTGDAELGDIDISGGSSVSQK
jgi:Putative auto-transporter adhesin, head GIN domain